MNEVGSVTFEGNWFQLDMWLQWVALGGYLPDLEDWAKEIASITRGKIRQHVMAQDLVWAPLKPYTIAKKGHSLFAIETGKYMKTLGLRVSRSSKYGVSASVFPSRTVKLSDGLTVAQVAHKLEYGRGRIAERPLWRPVGEEILPLLRTIPIDKVLHLDKVFTRMS